MRIFYNTGEDHKMKNIRGGNAEKIEDVSGMLINCNMLKLFKMELEKITTESLNAEIASLEKELTLLKQIGT